MQVYCYTFPNGKRYIGQTIHTFTKRAGYEACYWKGKKMSEETRRKMSESQHRRYAVAKSDKKKEQDQQTNLYLDALEDITGCKK